MDQILEYGEVRRGQIGVGIQDITPDLRDAFDLEIGEFGVLVTTVFEDSPADKAGVEAGDIIVAVDGKQTTSTGQLRSAIGIKQIGDKVRLTVLRDGKDVELSVKIGEPAKSTVASNRLPAILQGLSVDDNPDGDGVLVVNVAPNSTPAYSGLRPGDVIVGVNKRRVRDLQSFYGLLDSNATSVLLRVNRNGGSFFIVIR